MNIFDFIEVKKEQCKSNKTVLRMLRTIEYLIKGCLYEGCIKCPYSYGMNIKQLNCQFKIIPKKVTPEVWSEFCDEFKRIVFPRKSYKN